MKIEDIFAIISDEHAYGNPETETGITTICENICDRLDYVLTEDNWWTEDAMLCIAEMAYRAGLRQG